MKIFMRTEMKLCGAFNVKKKITKCKIGKNDLKKFYTDCVSYIPENS